MAEVGNGNFLQIKINPMVIIYDGD